MSSSGYEGVLAFAAAAVAIVSAPRLLGAWRAISRSLSLSLLLLFDAAHGVMMLIMMMMI